MLALALLDAVVHVRVTLLLLLDGHGGALIELHHVLERLEVGSGLVPDVAELLLTLALHQLS